MAFTGYANPGPTSRNLFNNVRIIMYDDTSFSGTLLSYSAGSIRCPVVCVSDMRLSKAKGKTPQGCRLRYLFDIPLPPVLNFTV